MHERPAILALADHARGAVLARRLHEGSHQAAAVSINHGRPQHDSLHSLSRGIRQQLLVGRTPGHQRRGRQRCVFVRDPIAGVAQHPAATRIDKRPVELRERADNGFHGGAVHLSCIGGRGQRRMNHGIGVARALGQTRRIPQIAAVRAQPLGRQQARLIVRPRQADYRVTRLHQRLGHRAPDVSGSTSQKYLHVLSRLPLSQFRTRSPAELTQP